MRRAGTFRFYSVALVLLGLLFSCTHDPADPLVPDTPAVPEEQTETFYLRPSLEPWADGEWQLGETLQAFDDKGQLIRLQRAGDGSYGPLDQRGQRLRLLTPGTADVKLDAAALCVPFPAEQYASSVFPDHLCIGTLASSSETPVLQPFFSIIRIRVSDDDVYSLNLRARGGENLAGTARILYDTEGRPLLDGFASASQTLRLRTSVGVLDAKRDYYLVTAPQALRDGLHLQVESLSGTYELDFPDIRTLPAGGVCTWQIARPHDVPHPTLGTGLRSVYLTTPQPIYSKYDWVTPARIQVVDDQGELYYESDSLSIKGRGNSTWWDYPKKPYALKLAHKADLLGRGKSKRYVLLANWMDRTLLRNDVSFELARRTSLEWTPSGEFVELYLNGEHQGNYWLGEKIKVEKSRLEADFLIEMDTYYDETWRFYTRWGYRVNQYQYGLPIGVKYPDADELSAEQFLRIQTELAEVEAALYEGKGDYRERMDMASFIDWYLVHEVTYNLEPNHPKSSFFHFRDGRLIAGPVWDFDWYTYQENTWGLGIRQSIYYEPLFRQAEFVAALKSRWNEVKPVFENVAEQYIESRAREIKASESINQRLWPYQSTVNGDQSLSFDEAILRMKRALQSRIRTVDQAIKNL